MTLSQPPASRQRTMGRASSVNLFSLISDTSPCEEHQGQRGFYQAHKCKGCCGRGDPIALDNTGYSWGTTWALAQGLCHDSGLSLWSPFPGEFT